MPVKTTHILPLETNRNYYFLGFDSVQMRDEGASTWDNETTDALSVATADVTFPNTTNSFYAFGKTLNAPWGGIRGTNSTTGITNLQSFRTWNGTVWVNETTDANSTGTNNVSMTALVGHEWYIGVDNIFHGVRVDKSTNTAYINGRVRWDYWNGTDWQEFTPEIVLGPDIHFNNNDTTGATNCRINEYAWDGDALSGWATNTINTYTGYHIRLTVLQQYTNPAGSPQSSITFSTIRPVNGKWEFWNGTSWAFFAPDSTQVLNGTADSCFFLASQIFSVWNPYSLLNWDNTSLNSISGRYVRYRITFPWITAPIGTSYISGYTTRVSKTIHIPETTNRVFENSWVNVQTQINGELMDSRGSVTYIRFDTNAWEKDVSPEHVPDSGESWTTLSTSEVSETFNTHFTGSSHVIEIVDVMIYDNQTNPADRIYVSNGTVELGYTYVFDETSQSIFSKTVRIPFQTNITGITTSWYSLGTIPILNTYLPESNKNIRHISLQIQGSTGTNSNSIQQISYRLNGGAEIFFGEVRNWGANSFEFIGNIDLTTIDTSITNEIEIRTSNNDFKLTYCSFILHITYDYDEVSTTRILNSCIFAMPPVPNPMGDIPLRLFKYFRIAEPGMIELKQSAFVTMCQDTNNPTRLGITIGNGSTVTYDAQAGNNGTSSSTICYSTLFTSSDISIDRGNNYFECVVDTSTAAGNLRNQSHSTYVLLNYESDKYTNGSYRHNKTIQRNFFNPSEFVTTASLRIIESSLDILTPNYFLNDAGFKVNLYHSSNVNTNTITVDSVAGDNTIENNSVSFTYSFSSNNETYSKNSIVSLYEAFKLYPEQPSILFKNTRIERFNPNLLRRFRFYTPSASRRFIWNYETYNSIYKTLSGQVLGFSGDGSGITVEIWCDSIKERVAIVTTTTGGIFEFICYDDTEVLYAVAERDDGQVINSQKEANSNNYIINFNTSSGTISYAYIG